MSVLVLVAVIVGAGAFWPITVQGGAPPPVGRFSVPQEGVSGTVLLSGQDVVLAGQNRLTSYAIETGAVRWNSAPCSHAKPAAPTGYRLGSLAAVVCEGELRLLDLETGKFRWSRPAPAATMLRVGGAGVVIGLGDEVQVLSVSTGEETFRWSPRFQVSEDLVVASGADTVLIGEDHRIRAFDASGTERWHEEVTPSSAWVSGSRVVVREPQSHVVIFDLRTGEVLDNDRVRGVETDYSMIVAAGAHRAVLARNEGNPFVFAVDDRTGELRWKSDAGRWFAGAGNGRVLVGTQEGCAVLRYSDGATIAECPEGALALDMDATRLASVVWNDDAGPEVVVSRIGR